MNFKDQIKDLQEKRNKLVTDNRAILDAAQKDGQRNLKSDEQEQYDRRDADIDSLDGQIRRLSRQAELEGDQNASAGRRSQASSISNDRVTVDPSRALRSWLVNDMSEESLAAQRSAGFSLGARELVFNLRGNNYVGDNTSGGYTVETSLFKGIEVALKKFGAVRQAGATILKTAQGNPMLFPTGDDTSNKGALIAEQGAVGVLGQSFAQVALPVYKFSSNVVLCSAEFIQDAAIDVPFYVGERIGERIARIENQYFTTGTGTNQPQGVVGGATWYRPANGTSLSTSVTIDQLIDLQHSVEASYRTNAKFMLHDDSLKYYRKVKDAQNNYIWTMGNVQTGTPDQLLGSVYVINNEMANTSTANAKSVLYGDFSKFWIRDVLEVSVQRLNELYALNNQVGFVGFKRTGSVVMDAGTHPLRGHQNAQAES
jgi:HK97 family phage major capsid protein